MTKPPFQPLWVIAAGSLLNAQALAAPESRLREATSPVARITAEQLSGVPSNRNDRAILDLHNLLRKEVGARPLKWNPALAGNAQRYAERLAQTGTVEHASRVGRENERENIVVGARSGISPIQMVQIWVKERQLFRPGKFPDICSGDWSLCGHYTQMIWPTTTDVGCAYATARFDAFVCRYSPPGNKDGVAVGPGAQTQERELAERVCTTPRGMVIACKNDEEEGGVIEDGGEGDQDSGEEEEEEVCSVDVNVHQPISLYPDEPVVADDKEFDKGATTLRNDDSDWRLGSDDSKNLPINDLPTDLTRTANANENDLVKVIALNPTALPDVFLFAFPTHSEANRDLGAKVGENTKSRHANGDELGYFTAANKPPGPVPALPRAIPGPTTVWIEAKLGGRYRLVIGKLLEGVAAGDVKYNVKTGRPFYLKGEKPESPFECEDQATVTAAVVDIFQRNTNDKSKRLTAFDVFWGGRPHFRADVWPGGNKYSWGEAYRLGADVHQMPGAAADGEVASMKTDGEDVENDNDARKDGPTVAPKGTARGGFGAKDRIEGGFQIETPRAGNTPTVNRDVSNRYPHRVSLQYEVNDEKLVRPEYLEVILPKVETPKASIEDGSATRVESGVGYKILDAFDRQIIVGKDSNIADYLYLYGAGLKAWEALEGQPQKVVERGPKNDQLFIVDTGVDGRGTELPDIGPLGTAQRSQAPVLENRMTLGIFQDTLVFTSGATDNAREALWVTASRRDGEDPDDTRERLDREAKARDNAINGRKEPADLKLPAGQRRGAMDQRRRAVPQEDLDRRDDAVVLSIPQDVILQLRVGETRHDLMVLQGNRLSVYAPHFFNQNKYVGNKNDFVFRYHIQFEPGAATSQLVQPNHRRPQ